MAAIEEAVASTTTVRAPRARGWCWETLVIMLLVGFLYYDVVLRLIRDWWNDPNFSHGFFVPAFSAFVFWKDRKRVVNLMVKPAWFGVVIIAGSLAMLIVGILGAELFLARTSLVFLLAGLVILFLGWKYFKAVLFPWCCLFLMIPIPAILFNQITLPLQFLASRLATWVLTVIGVPVLRQGNVIQLSSMPLEVAEACSGIRSLLSLSTLAVIYGYLLDRKCWRRTVLFLSAIPIAVVANAGRIAGTGVVAQYWDPNKAEGFFHVFSGWMIFVLSLGMLFLVQRGLRLLGTDESRTT